MPRTPSATQASVILGSLYLAYQAYQQVSLADASTLTLFLLYSSALSFFGIYIYIGYYLPLVKNIKLDFSNNKWRTTAPRLIQAATVSLITLYVTLSIVLSQGQAFHFLGFLVAAVLIAGVVAIAQLF
ncbi:hypothetical protein BDR26DRAFT_855667 [Obelidium mucronatum]|nr:hypothetical protein BDR26DRAFT_855667 [Obelidium mucronatum]